MTQAETGETLIQRRGMLLVLSSPSGGGKSTLARRILVSDSQIALSVSCTTRPARPGEVHGQDYYFTARKEFEEMARVGDLLEHAEVFGNLYGTPRAPVETWLEEGRDVLFDIDWQGARQLRQAMPKDMVGVFIVPPSLGALRQRLRARGQDSDAIIAGRMEKAVAEIIHWNEYSHVVINDDLEQAEAKIRAILTAERLRNSRRPGLTEFIQQMTGEH